MVLSYGTSEKVRRPNAFLESLGISQTYRTVHRWKALGLSFLLMYGTDSTDKNCLWMSENIPKLQYTATGIYHYRSTATV